jgi:hypothetical protein
MNLRGGVSFVPAGLPDGSIIVECLYAEKLPGGRVLNFIWGGG